MKTVLDWGAYGDRLEAGWLTSDEAKNLAVGTPTDWIVETHGAAKTVGGDQHTATSEDGATFDTDFIDPQQSSAPIKMTGAAGKVIAYHCEVHPAHMKGTVTIDP